MLQQMGKILLLLGALLLVAGGFLLIAGRIPFFGQLPGDIRIKTEKTVFFFPLTTSILLSILLTLLLWLLSWISRR